MCRSGDSFRFCSCEDALELRRPLWILERLDLSLAEQRLRGRVAMPTWSESEHATRESILDALRTGDCFDFDYEPVEGDVFIAELEAEGATGRPWRYRYSRSPVGRLEWAVDSSNRLSTWRSQMVQLDTGPIRSE